MVVALGVPVGVTAQRLLTQGAILPIRVRHLHGNHRLVLLAWDSARGGQEEQDRAGHCRSLKANLGERAGHTLRAGTSNTTSQIPHRQERERGSRRTVRAQGVGGLAGLQMDAMVGGRGKEGSQNTPFPPDFPSPFH